MTSTEASTIILNCKYRLLPTKEQHKALAEICNNQRILYNAALEERIGYYSKTGKTLSYMSQCKTLTELRGEPEYAVTPTNLDRWTLKRLDEAYSAFFRRVKAKGEKAGFPRFRGKSRWRSFGFNEFRGIRLQTKRIRFRGMPGSIRIHEHRPLPEGKPLCCTFTRDHKGWSVSLTYRVPVSTLAAGGKQVGIDVGLTSLATLSTGESIPNPRVAKRAEQKMRRRQRALARCKRGSRRRAKVKARLTRLQASIKNKRSTYLHQVSARLVREYDLIAVEKLNVKGLAAGMLAKDVHDAAWSKLNEFIAYKAEKAGRRFVEVDCRGTSQICPECGQIAKKLLSQRTHSCNCGCVLDRDHAAAIVILQRAVAVPLVSQREAA